MDVATIKSKSKRSANQERQMRKKKECDDEKSTDDAIKENKTIKDVIENNAKISDGIDMITSAKRPMN